MSLWIPFHTIIDPWHPLSTIPSTNGGSTATSITRPTQESSSICPPANQPPQNWPATKALPRTVVLRTRDLVSARTITPVRDPRYRNFTVSGVCFILLPRTDGLFDSSKRERSLLVACCISPSAVEILIDLRFIFGGCRCTGFMGSERMCPSDHIRV